MYYALRRKGRQAPLHVAATGLNAVADRTTQPRIVFADRVRAAGASKGELADGEQERGDDGLFHGDFPLVVERLLRCMYYALLERISQPLLHLSCNKC